MRRGCTTPLHDGPKRDQDRARSTFVADRPRDAASDPPVPFATVTEKKQPLWHKGLWDKGRVCPDCGRQIHKLTCRRLYLRLLTMLGFAAPAILIWILLK
jgi:hypothetical protein